MKESDIYAISKTSGFFFNHNVIKGTNQVSYLVSLMIHSSINSILKILDFCNKINIPRKS